MAAANRCPVCGSAKVRVESPERWEYAHCGLTGVMLEGAGVVLTDCPACAETTTLVRNEAQLQQVIGLSLVLGGPGLTGEELRYLRNLCGISQDDLARQIGRSRRETIADWEARGTHPVFRAPFDELNLRIVLMSLFRSHVIEAEYCCLSPRHVALFDESAASLIARLDELLEPHAPHGPLSVRRATPNGEWAPGGRAA